MIRISLDPATPGTGAIAIDPPLVAGEPAAVLVTGMAPAAGHEWRLVLSTHCHDRLLSATAPLEPVTDGYGATLELATRQIAAALALCCADGTITVALELVDATARASLCQTLAPLRNSVLAQGGTGDLPSWSVGVTVEQVEQIVSAALAPYATTAQVAAAIADALAPYATTAEVAAAIAAALAPYATTDEVAAAIAAALAALRLDRISDADASTVLRALPGSGGAVLSLSAPPRAVGHSESPAATLRADRSLAEIRAGAIASVGIDLSIGGASYAATAVRLYISPGEICYTLTRTDFSLENGSLLALAEGPLLLFRSGSSTPIVFANPTDVPGAPVASDVATLRDIPAPPTARDIRTSPVIDSRSIEAALLSIPTHLRIARSGARDTIVPVAGVLVYRRDLPATGAIPPLDIPADLVETDAYLCLELELRVPDPAPASITAPSGWTFVPDAPLPSSVSAGQVLHISLRVDGTDSSHPVIASCWLVA